MKTLALKLLKYKASDHKLFYTSSFGFTLLEMLIVMAIISSLAALFITSFPAAQRRVRDARRRSDLKQYDALLRDYSINHKGAYPGANTGTGIEMKCAGHACAGVFLCDALGLTGSNCLVDQYNHLNRCFNGTACTYFYQGSNCNDVYTACAKSFVLRAHLEGEAGWLVYCSNGSTGIVDEATDWEDLAGFCPI